MTETDFRGYFPGSKVPLPVGPVAVKQKPPEAWDDRPIKKRVNGKEVEFFLIGALCKALSRPAVTIRLWMRQGHLPESRFRMPDKNGIKGRRLYTRGQIEAVVRVFKAEGIYETPRVDWSKHAGVAEAIRREWNPDQKRSTD